MIRLSGRFRSALIIGIQGIRARKLRTFLSMTSLFLGVLAVVAVQAGAEIAKSAVLADIELREGRDGTVRMYLPAAGSATPVVLSTLVGRDDAVASTDVNVIIGEPGVAPVNPGGSPFENGTANGGIEQYGRVVCTANGCQVMVDPAATAPSGKAIELQLTAVTGDIRQFQPYRLRSGRWLDFTDAPSLAPRIVLNREAAEGFATYQVPAEMRVDGASANPTPQVIGVVDDGQYMPKAYVRVDELLNWLPQSALGGSGGGMQLMLAPDAAETQQILRSRLVASGVPADQIHTERVNSRKQVSAQLALMRWIFLGMAGLILLIGVAGILNVGLATVGERIEEFALRRAVGTARLLLAGIVLAETLLTGLFTAAAAIGVGALTLKVAGRFVADRTDLLQHLDFPWQAGVAGVIAGLVAGLLGGLVPAIRAARIPIANVMRA